MKFIKYCTILLFLLAVTAGCAPKRPPEAIGEKIPLPQFFTTILKRYEEVKTLQSSVFVRLSVGRDVYPLQGLLLYERPAHLRLRLTTSVGGTVGDLIYADGFLAILLPAEKKIYRGLIETEKNPGVESLFLTMTYSDYAEVRGVRFPTRISGETETTEFRFDLRLKDPQVDVAIPGGAFTPAVKGWQFHSLSDLKDLFTSIELGEGL